MSAEMTIFFNAPGELADVIAKLEPVLGIELRTIRGDDDVRYEYRGLGIELVCGSASGYEDSVGIEFSRYRFVLNVLPIAGDVDESCWWNLMYHSAMYCFARITTALKWPSIAVYNLQKLEARFEG